MTLRLWRIVLFASIAWFGSAPAQAQTCTATISSINFGSISPATTSSASVTGSVAVTCSGLVNLPMRVCINVGTGTGGATYAPRLASSGANTLHNTTSIPTPLTRRSGACARPVTRRSRSISHSPR
ncbi:spore coat protein U domain-containing protein [Candidatus Burkholderia verschuerenii]|uniref:spore coat protein U domain-containing protein n=1 Tax=Candidatus Burkholderia verschuerenii TaxID=242163 RepID=UPI0018DC7410|nr:spore coat protein U domain-containing protein [Candidatus Burkholderia verschuerenii]